MFRIGDFSRMSRVSIKALRYYDEIGLLKPASVDQFTGYRYYSAAQLPRLNRILVLRELGFSLDTIGELLDDDLPVARMLDIARGRQAEARQQWRDAQERLDRLEKWLEQVQKEGKMPQYQVSVKNVGPQTIASVRDVIPTYGDIGRLYSELFGYLGRTGTAPTGPPMGIYYDGEYKERDVDVEAAVPVGKGVRGNERVKVRGLPAAEQVACVVHQGDYSSIGQAYQALMAWAEGHGYRIVGNAREVYIRGPGEGNDPKTYVTEVQLQVEKA